jgi:hypothetical protein
VGEAREKPSLDKDGHRAPFADKRIGLSRSALGGSYRATSD